MVDKVGTFLWRAGGGGEWGAVARLRKDGEGGGWARVPRVCSGAPSLRVFALPRTRAECARVCGNCPDACASAPRC